MTDAIRYLAAIVAACFAAATWWSPAARSRLSPRKRAALVVLWIIMVVALLAPELLPTGIRLPMANLIRAALRTVLRF